MPAINWQLSITYLRGFLVYCHVGREIVAADVPHSIMGGLFLTVGKVGYKGIGDAYDYFSRQCSCTQAAISDRARAFSCRVGCQMWQQTCRASPFSVLTCG